ncbi:uncharacterized protein PV09_04482 [Verruconis gallopava]|uniref:Uncharacterized protein n=1 Tax=Verruconis gallopava TaxID=253628 RepID=A0A0D1XNL7_9PEZI|nr:uncharacterized protein PV09_04482 [Verruconis gallopava]KIW04166.1 hypothetical protein PV09_04482 [Verruconis gallopava]
MGSEPGSITMFDSERSGKVLSITGTASGMGLQTAKFLASKGCKLCIADIQERVLKKAKADIEANNGAGTCIAVKTDVRSQSQVDPGEVKHGRLLVTFIIVRTSLLLTEDWQFVLDVNLTGMTNRLRAQIPNLKNGAAIVNFASVSGQRAGPVNTFMMRETDNTGHIDMNFASLLALNGVGEVQDFANLIEFLLSDKSCFITGGTISINGGWI